jgi:type III pantothenate kinase
LQRTADEYAMFIEQALKRNELDREDVSNVIVASASPHLQTIVEAALSLSSLPTPVIVGPGVKTKLRIRFEPPTELSGDRIANSVAAYYLYGQDTAIVVDFGTATVFDVISAKGEYLGGVLTPGIRIAAEALTSKASRIPRVDFVLPPQVIGRTSAQALQSGLLYGHVDLLNGLLQRIKAEIGPARVIATGDDAKQFASLTQQIDVVEPHLTLHGLRLLYRYNS